VRVPAKKATGDGENEDGGNRSSGRTTFRLSS
jgi:hypothetical protein